jgi:anti-sigma-K factor RskA
VRTDDELFDLLDRALAPTAAEPPPDRVAALRARVEAAPPAEERGRRRWLAPLAAAAVLTFAAVVAVGLLRQPAEPPGVLEFAGELVGPDDVVAEATVRRTGIGRVVRIDTNELPILPTGEYYELWFVAPDDTRRDPNRISAGTFHPDEDGRSQVQFAAAVDPAKYPILSVTSEPGDGNPARNGPEVLRAEIELE